MAPATVATRRPGLAADGARRTTIVGEVGFSGEGAGCEHRGQHETGRNPRPIRSNPVHFMSSSTTRRKEPKRDMRPATLQFERMERRNFHFARHEEGGAA